MDSTTKVAIIAAIPPLVSSFIWGWVNHVRIGVVATNVNGKLGQLLEQKDAAATRADRAEGRIEGAASERDKQP
jgi:hypothetical protein